MREDARGCARMRRHFPATAAWCAAAGRWFCPRCCRSAPARACADGCSNSKPSYPARRAARPGRARASGSPRAAPRAPSRDRRPRCRRTGRRTWPRPSPPQPSGWKRPAGRANRLFQAAIPARVSEVEGLELILRPEPRGVGIIVDRSGCVGIRGWNTGKPVRTSVSFTFSSDLAQAPFRGIKSCGYCLGQAAAVQSLEALTRRSALVANPPLDSH